MSPGGSVLIVDVGRVMLQEHFALRRSGLVDGQGRVCWGLFGLLEVLERVGRTLGSSHLYGVCGGLRPDGGGDLGAFFREDDDGLPKGLIQQVERVPALLRAVGVPLVCEAGCTFGELVGPLLRAAVVQGDHCVVVTDRPPAVVAGGGGFDVYDLSQERLLDPEEVQALSERGEAESLNPGGSFCPSIIDLDGLRAPPVDPVERDRVLTELGLESFVRIPFGTSGPLESRGVEEYRVATTSSEVREIIHGLEGSGRYALYAEAVPGMDGGGAILAFVDAGGHAGCVPVGGRGATGQKIEKEVARDLLTPLLTDPSCTGVVHDVKSTGRLLKALELPVAGLPFDTAVAAYLLEPDRKSLSLDVVARDWLGVWREPPEDGRGEGAIPRCCEAAMMVWELAEKLQPLIAEEGLSKILEDVEIPFGYALGEMEDVGFGVDVELLERLEREFRAEKEKARDDVHRAVGRSFNLESHREVWRQFKRLGLSLGRRTKRGVPSITQEVLEENMDKHPVVPAFSRYRTMAGLLSTAASSLKAGKDGQGRVYPQMNQAGSETGRISVSTPPLQSMPVRTPEGRRLREAFVPSPGCLLISADYSQIELRVLAHLSGDKKLLEEFKAGVDIHMQTAVSVLGAAEDDASSREVAKAINFGIIYGMGPARMAREAKITRRKATNDRKKWFRRHRRVQEFRKELLEHAEEHGEVRTLLGRPLPMRRLDRRGERQVVSHVVQGSAADMMKLAMIQLYRRLDEEGWDARILLQVHDELILEAKESQAWEVGELTKTIMEGAMDLETPLEVKVRIGRNWAEVSK